MTEVEVAKIESPIESLTSVTDSDDLKEDLITSLNLSSSDNEEKDLSDLDKTLIKYLDLLDSYNKLAGEYSDNFKNGFINLSRANYASSRRFNKDFYDHRLMEPVINVSINGKTVSVVNNLELQKLEQVRDEKIESDSEKDEFEDEKESEIRNRKLTLKKLPNSTKLDTTTKPIYKNPINMFGAFVPYQLKESQKCFNSALENSIELINMRNELQVIFKEIKTAKKLRLRAK